MLTVEAAAVASIVVESVLYGTCQVDDERVVRRTEDSNFRVLGFHVWCYDMVTVSETDDESFLVEGRSPAAVTPKILSVARQRAWFLTRTQLKSWRHDNRLPPNTSHHVSTSH